MSVPESIHQSIHKSTHYSIHKSIHWSIRQSIHQSVHKSIDNSTQKSLVHYRVFRTVFRRVYVGAFAEAFTKKIAGASTRVKSICWIILNSVNQSFRRSISTTYNPAYKYRINRPQTCQNPHACAQDSHQQTPNLLKPHARSHQQTPMPAHKTPIKGPRTS